MYSRLAKQGRWLSKHPGVEFICRDRGRGEASSGWLDCDDVGQASRVQTFKQERRRFCHECAPLSMVPLRGRLLRGRRLGEHRQNLLVLRREDLHPHALNPPTAPGAGPAPAEPSRDSTSARPGIGRPRQLRLSRPERGLHPLGLLPQSGHHLPDVLLPGLQQSEHRRHSHLRERHEQTNHPNQRAREGSSRATSQNQKITFGKGWLLSGWCGWGTGGRPNCRSWSKRVGWLCRQAGGEHAVLGGEGLGRAAGARPVVRLGGRGRHGWNGEAYANDLGIPAP